MPSFSKRSADRLRTCRPELQDLFNEVVKEYDCTVLCGYRDETEQHEAFTKGYSKVDYPHSRHNTLPSMAVDVVPYHSDAPHIRWDDIDGFCHFADYVKDVANKLEIDVMWGGNFNHFFDGPHWELV